METENAAVVTRQDGIVTNGLDRAGASLFACHAPWRHTLSHVSWGERMDGWIDKVAVVVGYVCGRLLEYAAHLFDTVLAVMAKF